MKSRFSHRRIGLIVAITGLACACAPTQATDSAPVDIGDCRSIEIVVGFGVGGGTDTFSRNLSLSLAADIAVPVRVVNYPTGGGVAAYREILKRPADGCALMAVTSDYLVLDASEPKLVDISKLNFLVRAHTEPGLLSVKSSRFRAWDDLIENVRVEERSLLVGGVGAKSFDRAAVTIALAPSGIQFRYIPYAGSKQMQADLLGGRLDLIYDEYSAMGPLFEAGEVHPVVSFTLDRLSVLPDVPTSTELGLATPPEIWRGIGVAAETPQDITDDWMRRISIAMDTERYLGYEQSRRLDLTNGRAFGPVFSGTVEREREQFSTVLK